MDARTKYSKKEFAADVYERRCFLEDVLGTHRNTPGGLWWSYDGCEHLFGLAGRTYGPLVLASVLGGGRLRQAEGEGGTFAGGQDGQFAGVDGGRRGLREGHLWAALLAFVFHCCLLFPREVEVSLTHWLAGCTGCSKTTKGLGSSKPAACPSVREGLCGGQRQS